MTRVQGFQSHYWIIIFHVAFIANAQSDSPSPPQLQSGQNSSRTTVFASLVSLFFLVGLLSVYIRHCSLSNPHESSRNFPHRDGYSRRGGLDNAVVESFPVFAYASVKNSKIGSDVMECAICLNELEDCETVRLLPICNHLFHIDCIDAWLYSHATCPVCRSNLTAISVKTGEEEDDGETQAQMRDHVVIDISGLETVDAEKSHHRRLSSDITGKFPRSNSTGHSLGRLRDGTGRYTLRLPEDVRRRIIAAKGRRLKRTRSFDADLMAEYRGNYCRIGDQSCNRDEVGSGERSDWVTWAEKWVLFVSKSTSGSVRSRISNGGPLK